MQEQTITLETAKLAKEKGFNEPVKHSLNKDGSLPHKHLGYVSNSDHTMVNGYAAPEQSLLQKWLREVHNFHIEIYYNQVTYCVCTLGKGIVADKGFLYNTYEEALEIGLQEALKLCKTK